MFKIIRSKLFFIFMVGLAATTFHTIQGSALEDASNSSLDLNEIYALPNMIGTDPKGAVWSADNSQIAFLWNDKGRNFRDVWTYDVNTGKKQKLTNHDAEGKAKELDQGVSQIIWLENKSASLAYTLKGSLYAYGSKGTRQIEGNISGVRSLSLSPNRDIIAFTADGNLMIRAADVDDKTPAKLLVKFDEQKKFVQSFQWSADSRNIVFQSTDMSGMTTRDIHYYANQDIQVDTVIRAFPGGDTARMVVGIVNVLYTQPNYFERPNDMDYIWDYGLSADGDSLFINSSDDRVKHHTIYMYNLRSGKREVFHEEHDPKNLRANWRAAWAPNDDGLIMLTDIDGYLHLYHKKTATSKPRAITKGPWEIASFKVDTKGSQVYFIANKSSQPEQLLYRVPVAGGDVELVSDATPGTHEPVYSPDMRMAASVFSTNEIPRDLYAINLGSKQTTQVTKSPLPNFYKQPWGNVQFVNFKSHVDGAPLIGRMSLPKAFDKNKRYPLIVGSTYSDSVRNQFGGRIYHPTWGLDQYLTSIGYIVLNVNVRGSWGQGQEHTKAKRHSYGGIDIEDLHSGVKHLVAEGLVDEKRVGIWGSSYGGLMTMMSLFKKPGVYAAGVAGAPATNVRHAYPGEMWVMGPAEGDDQPERYNSQSAMNYTSGLEDALMIIHGSKDPVVLYADTIEVVERLIADEKMFELVTLPGVVHGWDAVEAVTRRFAFKKMVAFFNRYLHPET